MKPRIHHSIRDQAHVLLWASSVLLFLGFLSLGWPVSVNADPFDSGQFLASAGGACAIQSSHTETIGSVYAGVQATEAITIYLPFISKPQFDPCERILGESYTAISVLPPVTDRPAEIHADLNLSMRGYRSTAGYLGLIDLQGPTDPLAPQLPGLFKDARTPTFTSLYQVYDWDWGCNCRGAPITHPAVTLAGFAVAPGETIHVPSSGYTIGSELSVPSQGVTIGSGYEVLVLYASTERITLKYTREDNVVNGYTLHVENICVEPRLLALYQDWNSKGRRYLPALQAGQGFGRARDSEVRVAIRDNGSFMETRSRKDWWQGR